MARLWYLQGISQETFETASRQQRVRVVYEQAPRGRILDSDYYRDLMPAEVWEQTRQPYREWMKENPWSTTEKPHLPTTATTESEAEQTTTTPQRSWLFDDT